MAKTESTPTPTTPTPMAAALEAAGVIRKAIATHEQRRGELTTERAELTRLIQHHWNAPLATPDVRQALCKMIDAKMAAAEQQLDWPTALQALVRPVGERRRREGDDFIVIPTSAGTAPPLSLADVHSQYLQVFGAQVGPIRLGGRGGNGALLGEGETGSEPLVNALYVLLGEQLKQRLIEIFDRMHFPALRLKDDDPCAELSADQRAETIQAMDQRVSQIDEELQSIAAELGTLRATVA